MGDYHDLVGDTGISLPNNDNLNCTNVTMAVSIKMLEGPQTIINVPFNYTKDGCTLLLRDIPLSDHLSASQMEESLFYTTAKFPELYSRIQVDIKGINNLTNLARANIIYEISTAGLT